MNYFKTSSIKVPIQPFDKPNRNQNNVLTVFNSISDVFDKENIIKATKKLKNVNERIDLIDMISKRQEEVDLMNEMALIAQMRPLFEKIKKRFLKNIRPNYNENKIIKKNSIIGIRNSMLNSANNLNIIASTSNLRKSFLARNSLSVSNNDSNKNLNTRGSLTKKQFLFNALSTFNSIGSNNKKESKQSLENKQIDNNQIEPKENTNKNKKTDRTSNSKIDSHSLQEIENEIYEFLDKTRSSNIFFESDKLSMRKIFTNLEENVRKKFSEHLKTPRIEREKTYSEFDEYFAQGLSKTNRKYPKNSFNTKTAFHKRFSSLKNKNEILTSNNPYFRYFFFKSFFFVIIFNICNRTLMEADNDDSFVSFTEIKLSQLYKKSKNLENQFKKIGKTPEKNKSIILKKFSEQNKDNDYLFDELRSNSK
jgi:hypothetical protein